MHRKLLLVCLMFLLIGCTRVDGNGDYVSLVNRCLKDNIYTNDVSLGYRYYVPKGVRKVHDYDYNQIFLVDDTSIYLYVDIISYYYQNSLNYVGNKNSFYYQEFHHKDKSGYLEISQGDDLYFVTMVYHYSKIEFYAKKSNLEKIITLSSIILNSIDYNDKVIEKIMNGDFGEFSEINYEVKKPVGASGDFSQYLEEYVQKEKKEKKKSLPDE